MVERTLCDGGEPGGRFAAGQITEAYREILKSVAEGYSDEAILKQVGVYMYGSIACGWSIVGSDVDYHLMADDDIDPRRLDRFASYMAHALRSCGLHPDSPRFSARIERGDQPRNLLDLSRYDWLRHLVGKRWALPTRSSNPAVELALHIITIKPFRRVGEVGRIHAKRDPGGLRDIERLLWLTPGPLPHEVIDTVDGNPALAAALDFLLGLRFLLNARGRPILRLDQEGLLFLEDLAESVPWLGHRDRALALYDSHRLTVVDELSKRLRTRRDALDASTRVIFEALYDFDRLQYKPAAIRWHDPTVAGESIAIVVAASSRDRGMLRRLYAGNPSWPVLFGLARNPHTPEDILADMVTVLRTEVDRDIRLVVARNLAVPVATLEVLRKDPVEIVARAADQELTRWGETVAQ
jgi:hypothetical protein